MKDHAQGLEQKKLLSDLDGKLDEIANQVSSSIAKELNKVYEAENGDFKVQLLHNGIAVYGSLHSEKYGKLTCAIYKSG